MRLSFCRDRHSVFILILAASIGIATGAGLVYWSAAATSGIGSQSGGYNALTLGAVRQVTAVGSTDGPGGCTGPGSGLTEYCYTFGFVGFPGGLAFAQGNRIGVTGFGSTANMKFGLQSLSSKFVTSNATF